jgi:coatomer protein complex subunit gamma
MFSLPVFEHQLVMYVTADDKETFSSPFDISSIPVVTREQADAEDRTKKLTTATPTLRAPSSDPKATAALASADSIAAASAVTQKYQEQFSQIPEFHAYGAPLKSSSSIDLTESETEYVVTAVKHIFKQHIVLQFDVKNTLPDVICEAVSMVSTPAEDDDEATLEEDFIIPIAELTINKPGTAYVAFKKLGGDAAFPVTSFANTLRFTLKEIDPTTNEPEEGGYEDEYEVEDLDLNGSDYVLPAFAGSFSHVWEQVGAAGEEAEETLQLSGVASIAGECCSLLQR